MNQKNIKLSKALDIYLTVRGIKQEFISNCDLTTEMDSIGNAFVWRNTLEGYGFWNNKCKQFNKLQIIDLDVLFIPDNRIVCNTFKEVISLFRFLHLCNLTWSSGTKYTNKYELRLIKSEYTKNIKVSFSISRGKWGISSSNQYTFINYSDIIILK